MRRVVLRDVVVNASSTTSSHTPYVVTIVIHEPRNASSTLFASTTSGFTNLTSSTSTTTTETATTQSITTSTLTTSTIITSTQIDTETILTTSSELVPQSTSTFTATTSTATSTGTISTSTETTSTSTQTPSTTTNTTSTSTETTSTSTQTTTTSTQTTSTSTDTTSTSTHHCNRNHVNRNHLNNFNFNTNYFNFNAKHFNFYAHNIHNNGNNNNYIFDDYLTVIEGPESAPPPTQTMSTTSTITTSTSTDTTTTVTTSTSTSTLSTSSTYTSSTSTTSTSSSTTSSTTTSSSSTSTTTSTTTTGVVYTPDPTIQRNPPGLIMPIYTGSLYLTFPGSPGPAQLRANVLGGLYTLTDGALLNYKEMSAVCLDALSSTNVRFGNTCNTHWDFTQSGQLKVYGITQCLVPSTDQTKVVLPKLFCKIAQSAGHKNWLALSADGVTLYANKTQTSVRFDWGADGRFYLTSDRTKCVVPSGTKIVLGPCKGDASVWNFPLHGDLTMKTVNGTCIADLGNGANISLNPLFSISAA
ncbi:hypothetical protein BC830DRAFT_1168824 [Chytriomyces sp. MP71]|nr:hypothetical protein BC830DRAFT_1168824 [Chytriomyces sp. MP71]